MTQPVSPFWPDSLGHAATPAGRHQSNPYRRYLLNNEKEVMFREGGDYPQVGLN